MKRTRILFDIMCVLLVAIFTTIFLKNYEFFEERFVFIKTLFSEKTVNIPYTTINKRNYTFKSVKTIDNFIPMNKEDLKKIYYTTLNNGWDDFTFYCPKEYKECYDDVLSLADNNDYLSLINNYVSTYNQYKKFNTSASSNGEIRLTIEKVYSKEKMATIKLKVSSILNSLNIDKNNIKKEDILKIHDYIIKLLTYDEEYEIETGSAGDVLDAIKTQKTICSGYTDLFSLFLDELNIPNFKVSTSTHIWNAIYFDNEWKHIDITWDDDEINSNNNHNFFMIDTNDLLDKDKKEHNFNKELFIEFN